MKKLLSGLALVAVLGVAGCGKSHKGVYEFESISVNDGTETVTYTCTTEEKAENVMLEQMCDYLTTAKYELKDDKIVVNMGEGETDEAEYKIEDGKVMIKEEDEYIEFASYKDEKLIISAFGEGMTVTYKKK